MVLSFLIYVKTTSESFMYTQFCAKKMPSVASKTNIFFQMATMAKISICQFLLIFTMSYEWSQKLSQMSIFFSPMVARKPRVEQFPQAEKIMVIREGNRRLSGS